MFNQVRKQSIVLDCSYAVADAAGAQVAERAPDAGGTVAFPGVGHRLESGGPSAIEVFSEQGSVDASLDTAEPESDEGLWWSTESELERGVGGRQPAFACDVEDPSKVQMPMTRFRCSS